MGMRILVLRLIDFIGKFSSGRWQKYFSRIMPRCSVSGCGAEAGVADVTLFKFPAPMRERQRWIAFIGKQENWNPTASSRICSLHFIDGKPTIQNPTPTVVCSTKKLSRDNFTRSVFGSRADSGTVDAETDSLETKFAYGLTSDDSGDIFTSKEKVRKRKSQSAPATPAVKRVRNIGHDNDHRYFWKLRTAVDKKETGVSFTFSSNGSDTPLATSSQPSNLLKVFMKKRRRRRIEDFSTDQLRQLALKYIKRWVK